MSAQEDFGRRILMEVTADGAVVLSERGSERWSAAVGLPVYSTDTLEEAEAIRERHCRRARDRSGVYRLNVWKGEVDDLDGVTKSFRETHAQVLQRQKRTEGGAA